MCRRCSRRSAGALRRGARAFSVHRSSRPALVISGSDFQRDSAHVLLAMITTARRSSWPLDWPIHNLVPTGLAEVCLVRFKLFTLDERLILGQLGQLAAIDRRGVRASLRQLIPACKISDHGRP